MSTAIRFDHVSKRFTLHHHRPRSFQEMVIQWFKRNGEPIDRQPPPAPGADGRGREAFWAVRDMTFSVDHGDTVGIIGQNGAGKSTVLKLISRIIEPTSGDIVVNGRVGALLELGAGFHPDLTGRENIYLNGSILGLSRAEIHAKADDIIAFAELERFIDIPVKHYSSGMRMRLGFSIASRIDPHILLIDEVLAVGDVAFQRKCLDRIKALQQNGVTIIFVSHAIDQVADLCQRAYWLDDGRVRSRGPTREVIADYLGAAQQGPDAPADAVRARLDGQRWGNQRVLIEDVRLLGAKGADAEITTFSSDESVSIEIDYVVRSSLEQFPAFGIAIDREDGVRCYGTNTQLDAVRFPRTDIPAAGTVVAELPALQLMRGTYTLDVAVHDASGNQVYDYIHGCLSFEVVDHRGDQGLFRPELRWSLRARG